MYELAVGLIERIPEDIDSGLVAGALGVVLGCYMERSFTPELLFVNTLRLAKYQQQMQSQMRAETEAKH